MTALLRTLRPGDEAALERFLRVHTDSSMFLRSNARAGGLEDRGEVFQATYGAAFDGGEMVGVAAHCWNGVLLLQAPVMLEQVAGRAVAASRRSITGLSGPADQVVAVRRALGMEGRPAAKDSTERLYALATNGLLVPPLLTARAVVCRPPESPELDLVTKWRVAFAIEALGLRDSPAVERDAHADMLRHQRDGSHWILLAHGTPVAYSAFNARLPDVVQVGGVWTPPEHRGRGYGRAVVAGSLIDARREGVTRAVLFTDDAAAQRAYKAIGFQHVADYGLVLFEEGY